MLSTTLTFNLFFFFYLVVLNGLFSYPSLVIQLFLQAEASSHFAYPIGEHMPVHCTVETMCLGHFLYF